MQEFKVKYMDDEHFLIDVLVSAENKSKVEEELLKSYDDVQFIVEIK